jgi:hypothetical protein
MRQQRKTRVSLGPPQRRFANSHQYAATAATTTAMAITIMLGEPLPAPDVAGAADGPGDAADDRGPPSGTGNGAAAAAGAGDGDGGGPPAAAITELAAGPAIVVKLFLTVGFLRLPAAPPPPGVDEAIGLGRSSTDSEPPPLDAGDGGAAADV